MNKGNTSVEVGELPPVEETTATEILEIIALRIQKLGPEGADVLRQIQLAERDLRLAAAFDPKLVGALERAEQLAAAREALQTLLESVVEHLPVLPTQPLGELALNHTSENK